MSFVKHKKFRHKNYSTSKLIVITAAVLLVAGGIYAFSGENKFKNLVAEKGSQVADSKQETAAAEDASKTNPSGLGDMKVRSGEDVEKVLAKWIEANPQAIIQSVANMQKKAMEGQLKEAQKNISTKKEELFNDKESPVYDRGETDVTIVEFFDYSCGYCKRAQSTVEQLVASDPKIKLIYKEFPILGQASEDLSSVSIAVHLLDSSAYKKFHEAMMKSSARNKADAFKVAKSVGINQSKLESVLKSKKEKIGQIIQANRVLGSSIGVNGTPGFVIGEELIPGAVDLETFKQKIAAERGKTAAAK